MAFPNIDWDAIRANLSQAFDAQGTVATVVLRGGTGTFSIKATQGHRRDADLTDGLQQGELRVRVLADDWDTLSPGRAPEKGDQISMWGVNHAIEAVHIRGVADEKLMYVFSMKG